MEQQPQDPQSLLQALRRERERFSEADTEVMQQLIDRLVQLKVYPEPTPAMSQHGISYLRMVENWGADWHTWSPPLNCPHCNSDLRDTQNGPPFKREVGIEIPSRYDGIDHFQCPDCQGTFRY